MDLVLWMNTWILVCAMIGFFYGVRKFFKLKKPMFLQIVTCAVGCMMFARLFPVVFILTHGELNPGFNIGMLGIAGSLMFLLSANYGQMDSLVDDHTNKFLRTRIIALIAPVIVIAVYVYLFMLVDMLTVRIGVGVVVFFMIPCIYYNFKHIIIYDIDLGLIRQLRMYNILAVVYSFTMLLEFISAYIDHVPLYIGTMGVQGMITLLLVFTAERGVMKWPI